MQFSWAKGDSMSMQGHYQDEETPVLIKPIDYISPTKVVSDFFFFTAHNVHIL